MPNKVLASRFNTLKARVDKLLGPATETNRNSADYRFGYGEAIGDNVAQSSSNDLIDALAYKKLYMNIQKVKLVEKCLMRHIIQNYLIYI